ncbi:MAG: CHAT domain-containing tetratricopeptide repeat protein [Gemmatimonadota bacterium]
MRLRAAALLGTLLASACSSSVESSLTERARTLLANSADGFELSGGVHVCSRWPRPTGPEADCSLAIQRPALAGATRLAADVDRALNGVPDRDALWAAALLGIALPSDRRLGLDAAARRLRHVIALEDAVDARNDLGVALALEGDEADEPEAWLAALDQFDSVLLEDGAQAAARANRNLVLQRLGLPLLSRLEQNSPAPGAGTPAAPRDSTVASLRSLLERGAEPPVRLLDDLTTGGSRRVLEFALVDVLAPALQDSDSVSGARWITARSLATWLRDEPGDSALAGALDAAARGAGGVFTKAGAEALRAYARGRLLFLRSAYAEAGVHLAEAEEAWRVDASPLLPAATFWAGVTRYYAPDPDGARQRFRTVLEQPSPTFRAYAHWGLGIVAGRQGDWQEAVRHYRASLDTYEQLRDPDGAAGARFLLGDVYGYTGQPGAALHELLNVIPEHRRLGSFDNLHNELVTAGRLSLALGHVGGARAFFQEALLLAESRGEPRIRAEARVELARSLSDGGRVAVLLSEARTLIDSVPDVAMQERLEAEAASVEGASAQGATPASLDALDRSLAYFQAVDVPILASRLLVVRAHAHVSAGDTVAAIADLEHLLAAAEKQTARSDSLFLKLMLRGVVDDGRRSLLDLYLGSGQEERALGLSSGGLAPPEDGQTRIVFAEGKQRLWAWIQSSTGSERLALSDDADAIYAAVARYVAALSARLAQQESAALSRGLYESLMRPLVARIPEGERLEIVTSGPLGTLPFAALLDEDDAPLMTRFSLAYPRAVPLEHPPSAEERAADRSILVVADPAFAADAHPLLSRLPMARVEADSLTALFAAPLVLSGSAAARSPVLGAARSARVLHFAGHAVLNEHDPQRSSLLLAADSTGGELTAAEIAALDLTGTELVFLSACNTARPVDGVVLGFGPLSSAFLAAGVDAVVGTLWAVDDRIMARVVPRIYRALADGSAPDVALATVQRELGGSQDPALRSPSTWAALRIEARR